MTVNNSNDDNSNHANIDITTTTVTTMTIMFQFPRVVPSMCYCLYIDLPTAAIYLLYTTLRSYLSAREILLINKIPTSLHSFFTFLPRINFSTQPNSSCQSMHRTLAVFCRQYLQHKHFVCCTYHTQAPHIFCNGAVGL